MKYCVILALLLAPAYVLLAADDAKTDGPSDAKAAPASELKTVRDRASYGLGFRIATSIKRDGYDIDVDLLTEGFKDAFVGKNAKLTEQQIIAALQAFSQEMEGKAAERKAAVGRANAAAGDEFLAANLKKEGVKQTGSGLQYKVLKAGTGAKPSVSDTVQVHYEGRFINGTVFDSSIKRGKPATFGVNKVISGWTEALQLMPVGSRWEVYVPGNLAYGSRGSDGAIGPNTTLIFTVELLSIVK